VSAGTDPLTVTRRFLKKTCDTKKQAEIELTRLINQVDEQQVPGAHATALRRRPGVTTPRAHRTRRRCRPTMSRRSAPSPRTRDRRSRQGAAAPPWPRAPRSAGSPCRRGRVEPYWADHPRAPRGPQPTVPATLATDSRGFGGGSAGGSPTEARGRRGATELPTGTGQVTAGNIMEAHIAQPMSHRWRNRYPASLLRSPRNARSLKCPAQTAGANRNGRGTDHGRSGSPRSSTTRWRASQSARSALP
jgi:hypothetical protein